MSEQISVHVTFNEDRILPFFEDAIGVVTATHFEIIALAYNFLAANGLGLKHEWEKPPHRLDSIGVGLGQVGTKIVYVVFTSAIVDGQKVIFVDGRGSTMDYDLLDGFLDRHLPSTARMASGRRKLVDALSFDEIFV